MSDAGPNRQSIRKKGWDYTAPGWYFVTINTQGGRLLFGTVVNGRMALNDAGRVAAEEWRKGSTLRRNVVWDTFVVMPNHVHGLVRIFPETGSGVPRPCAYTPQFGKPVAGSLGTCVGAYKAAVARQIHRRRGLMHQAPDLMHQGRGLMHQAPTIWHRNYWDVIVRDETALAAIRHYILSNPQNYHAVMNVGAPRFAGNRALLDRPKLGFLASRGTAAPHGRLPIKPGEVILSGFLSPMERAVFRACLEQHQPMIWVKAWGIREEDAAVRRAVEESLLLLVSPFDEALEAPSARRAAWCNHYVLAHCDRLVVGFLNPGGMLDCILSEADPELEITLL